MDEGLLIVLDYDKICRLCLQSRNALSNLFDSDPSYDGTSLVNQIKLITSVEIDNDDTFPYQICYKCRYEVDIAFQLRETVIKSHLLLSGSSEMDLEKLSEVLVEDGLSQVQMDVDIKDDIMQAMLTTAMDETKYVNNINVLKPSTGDEYEEGDVDAIDNQEPSIEENVELDRSGDCDKNIRKRKTDPVLVCQLCLGEFYSPSDQSKHISMHYSDYPELLPYHLAEKPYDCGMCSLPRSFNFRSELITHHREHLNMNPYKCSEEGCNSAFRSKEMLRQHSYGHAAKKFVCEICGAAFRRKSELGQHCIRHQDEGTRYECPLCKVICKNRISYKAHIRHHEQGKRFKCPRSGCPKAFFSRGDLEVHERSHTNDKRYKCHLCVCAYISQSQLNRHLKQHERRKVTKCDKCTMSFSDYAKFCNHRISVHGEWLPHRCKHCKQGYQNIRALDRHISRCKYTQKQQAENIMFTHKEALDMEDVDLCMKSEDSLSLGASALQNNGVESSFLYMTDMESQDPNDSSNKDTGESQDGPHYMIIHQVKSQDLSLGEQDIDEVAAQDDGHYMIIKNEGVWEVK